MARRIDIELTSARDDGTWTWRAAGAREPKGVVEASKLPGSPTVGDVLRVDVEVGLDGTDITAVLPPKGARKEAETLQLLGRELKDDELVTSKLVGKRGRRDRDDDDRRGGGRGGRGGERGRGGPGGERGRGGPGGRDGRPGGGGDRPGGDRGRHPRGDGERRGGPGDRGPRREGGGGPRSDRPRRPPVDEKPRPKRLRAQRTHRRAVLDTLEAHERPIADEVLRGGIPAVRQAVEKQNAQARAEGRPEVDAAQLEALAERMLPRLRAAEWRDRADAALADLDELDLRDLRTVVVAADSNAKDDEAKALASQLREGLERRIEADHAAWLAEMVQLLDDGRVVRALRVSSRPPKAGAPLPADLATRMIESTTASLTADTFADRWETVLDALSLSPIHARVAPASIPAEPTDELKATVAGFGERVPLVAQAFGVEPTAAPRRPRRGGPPRGKGGGAGGGGRAPQPPKAKKPVPPPPPVGGDSAPVGERAVSAEATEAPPAASETAAPATDATAAPEAAEPATTEPEAPAAEPAPAADAPAAEAVEAAPAEDAPAADAPAEVPVEANEADATGTEAEAVEPAAVVDDAPEVAADPSPEADAGDVTGTEAVEVAPSEDPDDAAGADET